MFNQRGSVLVITLLVLAAVTILGVVSINTSMVELQIAGNEKLMRESFYLAEAAALEGLQHLMSAEPTVLNEKHLPWHHSRIELGSQGIDFRNPQDWDIDMVDPDNGIPATLAPHTFMAAVEWRVSTGSSLIATDTRLYINRLHGLCTKDDVDTLIEIGYRFRY